MATEAEGLLRVRGDRTSRVHAGHGLCANTSYSLLDDGQDRFWLGSPTGIFTVSLEELDAVADGKAGALQCRAYGLAEGMRSTETSGGVSPAASRGQKDRLLFATRGVVAIQSRSSAKLLPPEPLIEAAEYLPGHRVAATLPLGQRDVSLRFTVPYFSGSRQWPLEYRLAGYDQRWQSGASRVARYTNLPPGVYRFEVRSAEIPAPVSTLTQFEVPPRFEETPAFLWLSAAVVLGAGLLFSHLRTIRIERRRQELELLVEERTREARDAANVKSEFLANMSHEIRTPMNGTLGAAELLAQMSLPAEVREHVEMIQSSGEALLVLINDILDYSKIEAGKLELEAQPFSLLSCVDDAMGLMAINSRKKGLDLGDYIDANVPDMVVGDAVRLRQMLLNLMSNALKFTAAGSVWLRVEGEAAPGSPEAAQLHFSVTDTGIGISAEGQARLFQNFSQADASTTRRFGGTGLGLAITKRLCTAMGGRIWVESREGVGSSFHFTIPLSAAPAAEQAAPENRLVVLAVSRPGWRDSIQQRLLRLGYICQVAPAHPSSDFELPPGASLVITDSAAWEQHPQLAGVRTLQVGSTASAATLGFPLRQSSLRRMLGNADVAPQPENPLASLPKERLRILVAEDNMVNQRVMLGMLRRLGYEADMVDNGVRALAALASKPYDVVLLDVQMPEMDGIETARHITRNAAAGARPALIAVTAGAFAQDRENCLAAGMDAFLSKPLQLKALATALASVSGLSTLAEKT